MTPKCCEHGGVYRVVDKCGCVLFEESTGLQHDLCGECKIQMKDDAVREARKMERELRRQEQRREIRASRQLERDLKHEKEPSGFRKFWKRKQKRKPSPFIGSFDQLPHHPTPDDLRADGGHSRCVPQDRGCGKRTPMRTKGCQNPQALRYATLPVSPVVSQPSIPLGNRTMKTEYLAYNPACGWVAPVDERSLSSRAESETAPPTTSRENNAVILSASASDQALYGTAKVYDTFFPPWTMALGGIHPSRVKTAASARLATEDVRVAAPRSAGDGSHQTRRAEASRIPVPSQQITAPGLGRRRAYTDLVPVVAEKPRWQHHKPPLRRVVGQIQRRRDEVIPPPSPALSTMAVVNFDPERT